MRGKILIALIMLESSLLASRVDGSFSRRGKVLLYPVGHCYNSLLLTMERMASFLSKSNYDVSMIINDNYQGTKGDVDMSAVKLVQFPAPKGVKTVCDMEEQLASGQASMSDIANVWMSSTTQFCESLLNSSLITSLKLENFDLLIVDRTDWCSAIVADALDIPFMTFASVNTAFSTDELARYLHTPSMFHKFPQWPLSLCERSINALIHILVYMTRAFFLPPISALKDKYEVKPNHHLTEVYSGAVITLLNNDQRVDYPRPLYYHEVEIGFLFPEIIVPKISSEILQFIGNTEDIILVSFGSQIGTMHDNFLNICLETFSKLPYKFIWRVNNYNNTFSNVLGLPWIPQSELLASGRIRLLITHGGFASSMEAIYNGVPMIIIPMQDEQAVQAERLTNYLKVARTLDFHMLDANIFTEMVNDVLGSELLITDNVRTLSGSIRNSALSPTDVFLYWVNKTIHDSKTPAAKFLPKHPMEFNIVQWLMMDVFAMIFISSILMIFGCYLSCCCVRKTCCRNPNMNHAKVD